MTIYERKKKYYELFYKIILINNMGKKIKELKKKMINKWGYNKKNNINGLLKL